MHIYITYIYTYITYMHNIKQLFEKNTMLSMLLIEHLYSMYETLDLIVIII